MAVGRRVVDRDLERRVLGGGETGEDEEGERDREAPSESRGGQGTDGSRRRHHRSSECDLGLLPHEDESRVAKGGCGVTCGINANRLLERRFGEFSLGRTEAVMNALYTTMERWRPYVLSVLRIVMGLLFLEHGLSKVFSFPTPSPVASLTAFSFSRRCLKRSSLSCSSLAPTPGSWRSSFRAKWPLPTSWRTRRARFTRSSTPENWRSCSASYSSISPSQAVVR